MDEFSAKWIIEYLLRRPIDDSVIERLLSALPYPKDDSQLKKGLLLRKIRTKVSNGELSEEMLGLLESVGELECREEKGKAPSEAMQAAYCAVAVACTVKFLECNDLVKFHDTVKNIWRVRVTNIEKSENSGLVTAKLLSWRQDLDAAIHDVEFRDTLLSRNLRDDALKALNAYISESWKEIGPTLLEKAYHLDKIGKGKGDVIEAPNDTNPHSLEIQNEQEVSSGTNVEKASNEKNMNKTDCIATPEIRNTKVVPQSSFVDLNAAVKDPLPESSQIAENAKPQTHIETQNKEEVSRSQNVEKANNERSTNKTDCIPTPELKNTKAVPLSSFVDLNAVVDPLPESSQTHRGTNLGGNNGGEMSEVSMMPIDKTDHLEANRVENTEGVVHREREVSGNGSRSDPLKIPMVSSVSSSPLKKRKFWSNLEEDTLRDGVREFGRGNWKAIFDAYSAIFEGRTYVDLKDKWRNMTH